MKDISQFKVGEIATSYMSKISYKVVSFNYVTKGRKRLVESSNCINIDTGNEVVITWNKNKSFI